jgi:hypothetical protein
MEEIISSMQYRLDVYMIGSIYIYLHICIIWMNYNYLNVTSLEWCLIREIFPTCIISAIFSLVISSNSARYI